MQSQSVLLFPMEGLEQESERGGGSDNTHARWSRLAARAAVQGEPGLLDQEAVQQLWQALRGKLRSLQGLALVLQLKFGHLYAFRIRRALPTTMPKLHHSFIVATLANPDACPHAHAATQLIVDPFFREQFAIGLADSEYQSFLASAIPEVFVGRPKALQAILEVACVMMRSAMDRLQLGTPPWRQPEIVVGMWFPAFYADSHMKPHLDRALATAPVPMSGKLRSLAGAPPDDSISGPVLPPRSASAVRPQVTKFCAAPSVVVVGFDVAGGSRPVAAKEQAEAGLKGKKQDTRAQDQAQPGSGRAAGGQAASAPACALPPSNPASASSDAVLWQFQRSPCQSSLGLPIPPGIAMQHFVQNKA